LTTGLIPHGALGFELEFDFISHVLVVRVSDGGYREITLSSRSVADFCAEVLENLVALGVPVEINDHPNEIPDPVPFVLDTKEREYQPASAHGFWLALVQCDRVFKLFRTRFVGKCSPVHFFWGSFDLAVTRFSGRSAPLHPGGVPHLPDAVTREAYSHEVSSAGFWPGGGATLRMPLSILIATRRLRASRTRWSAQPTRGSIPSLASLFCHMIWFGTQATQTQRY
jgi:hypothetical protein